MVDFWAVERAGAPRRDKQRCRVQASIGKAQQTRRQAAGAAAVRWRRVHMTPPEAEGRVCRSGMPHISSARSAGLSCIHLLCSFSHNAVAAAPPPSFTAAGMELTAQPLASNRSQGCTTSEQDNPAAAAGSHATYLSSLPTDEQAHQWEVPEPAAAQPEQPCHPGALRGAARGRDRRLLHQARLKRARGPSNYSMRRGRPFPGDLHKGQGKGWPFPAPPPPPPSPLSSRPALNLVNCQPCPLLADAERDDPLQRTALIAVPHSPTAAAGWCRGRWCCSTGRCRRRCRRPTGA